MVTTDDILKKFGLKYEDLSAIERETLNKMISSLRDSVITVERIKEYISVMKDSVEQELTKTDINTKQDIFLKARLRNYMLLDAFLKTPEKAEAQLNRAINGITTKKP